MPQIQNRTKAIQQLNIPCRAGCDGTGCLCSEVVTALQEELEDGTKGTRVLSRKLAGSLVFLGSETKDVPSWVAESGPVKAAIARGRLRLIRQ